MLSWVRHNSLLYNDNVQYYILFMKQHYYLEEVSLNLLGVYLIMTATDILQLVCAMFIQLTILLLCIYMIYN